MKISAETGCQAIATIAGKNHYLGPKKSEASRIEYGLLIGEWLAVGRPSVATAPPTENTVSDLAAKFWRLAQPYCRMNGRTPRGVLNLNRGFVELVSHGINRLRRNPIIEFYAWNMPPASKKDRNDPDNSVHDPLRLTRYYQSLLDTGKLESRVALARFLGDSRALVTQVLNRLITTNLYAAESARFESPPHSAVG